MLRRLFLIVLLCPVLAFAQLAPPAVNARAWLLLDVGSGQVLTAEKPDERIEPASLTKLMTAYLTFSAVKAKTLSLDQTVPVSEKAWKISGSKMFIEPLKPVTVRELIHGMIVQSGNDACVALAEAIAGSEENFVQLMNKEAARLGLKNTHFENSTGLPHPAHLASVRDLAALASAIIRDFPEFYPIYSTKEYTYNKITQPNRNRLLFLDPTVDGVKTGHTESAGYCLIASAKRNERRLISVVVGTTSDSVRAAESQKLLNWGYLAYDAVKVYSAKQPVQEFRLWKGAANSIKVGFLKDLVLSLPKGDADKLKMTVVSQEPLIAPVTQGQPLATLQLTLDGKPVADYPLVALDDVPQAGWFGRVWDAIRLWFKSL
ncbi:MAG TPA: D-alanyl-D-alanine carboxypeptidase family protein [Zoogloea sp.]|uniref:D-alanyl-D-alanine carboxypeptidase family protein n=1 Tax=Zoogloea sp. TaxID=49181 RepID=UPI002C66720C|nr:D-alanyl-D-alanine carboxypeptidase family protein [Zoogloea sp.]HMV19410.1 D-alanyl-D-alanine carboxypeptidase family protein [Rhodocyclaceae bacterium]HMV63800.1 D-alanyl-D-alanine carboxypeptidase family protein [Rhodocyclaceae bacterium]HMY51153.1 D-alanyl-D-alanine carboxypeptidase family protein [Rhodocyclaceae bacterium]HNA68365.1 D-alanyl-D-alanine carboxypeptidase family protein [Rhodocyclaceae bacterium]HNB66082.1 D-alanyl-D-alanine carboxypeptidase family protein [Rhodocyclaceae 